MKCLTWYKMALSKSTENQTLHITQLPKPWRAGIEEIPQTIREMFNAIPKLIIYTQPLNHIAATFGGTWGTVSHLTFMRNN